MTFRPHLAITVTHSEGKATIIMVDHITIIRQGDDEKTQVFFVGGGYIGGIDESPELLWGRIQAAQDRWLEDTR